MQTAALWIRALTRHWWALMSCAAFTFLGTYVIATNKTNTWALSATFGMASAMFLVASFLAWRDEHQKVVALNARFKGPEIQVSESIFIAAGSTPSGETAMFVGVTISNPYGPPASLTGWDFKVTLPDHATIACEIMSPYMQDVNLESGGRNFVLKWSDYLPKMINPIPAGGVSSGWIAAKVPGVTKDVLWEKKAVVTISFNNVVDGKVQSFSHAFDSAKRRNTPLGY